jgi:hypothetical protein
MAVTARPLARMVRLGASARSDSCACARDNSLLHRFRATLEAAPARAATAGRWAGKLPAAAAKSTSSVGAAHTVHGSLADTA